MRHISSDFENLRPGNAIFSETGEKMFFWKLNKNILFALDIKKKDVFLELSTITICPEVNMRARVLRTNAMIKAIKRELSNFPSDAIREALEERLEILVRRQDYFLKCK
jgi:hypothetical protein